MEPKYGEPKYAEWEKDTLDRTKRKILKTMNAICDDYRDSDRLGSQALDDIKDCLENLHHINQNGSTHNGSVTPSLR